MLGLVLLGLAGVLSFYLLLKRNRRERRHGEPPLIKGWIPVLGKALEYRKDAHKFLTGLKDQYGDIFTVQIAGKYMTFIMNPLLYRYVIKHGKQLDFHEFSEKVAPIVFGYPSVLSPRFPDMLEHILRSYRRLQGNDLSPLIENMMSNLLLVFRQDYLAETLEDHATAEGGWRTTSMYQFCNSVMFEATVLTLYGRPAHAHRHSELKDLRQDFNKFDDMFPLLVAQIPIWLLGWTQTVRNKLINFFLPQKMLHWDNTSHFITERSQVFDRYSSMKDIEKAAHHFAMLWASVGNTVPAAFWAMYHLLTHPQALKIVHQEILGVLKLSDDEDIQDRDVTLTKEQLDSLVHLGSAVNESLRLSSASMNIRVAQEDFSLQLEGDHSVAVRKGDVIALYPQSMHMDPEIYQQPEKYQYDRYVENGKEKTDFYKDQQKLKYYLMPFGSGVSMCPGRHFAVNEIKQFLSILLLYFELEVPEGQQKVTLDCSRAGLGILLPANDTCFRYRPRRASRVSQNLHGLDSEGNGL